MNLLPSQILLLVSFLAFGVYILFFRTILSDRVILLGLTVVALVLVVNPDLSTRVANVFGIGRGTDMLIYLFILFSLFRFVTLSASIKANELKMTELVRELAIVQARQGAEPAQTLAVKPPTSRAD